MVVPLLTILFVKFNSCGRKELKPNPTNGNNFIPVYEENYIYVKSCGELDRGHPRLRRL
jgi:hypothetical protein